MNEPYVFVTGLHSVMSQLSRVRADLVSKAGKDIQVDTHAYRCDTVAGLDRLLTDIRARRIREIRITDSKLGARRLVINYFGA
ncbi:hypothetical protein [Caballeronia sp. KNU42]